MLVIILPYGISAPFLLADVRNCHLLSQTFNRTLPVAHGLLQFLVKF